MRTDIKRLFVWMSVFFMAMAFLESAVVVFLRALYYPSGFDFPLVPMDQGLITTEVLREVATMVMLLAPGALVTRSALERFAWFCYGFGVWDIFYYVWLKVLLDWPASLGTFDLLFLIPAPWVGPVWAPCLISIGLIVLAILILRRRSGGARPVVDTGSWLLLILGAVLMIASFLIDPLKHAAELNGLAVHVGSHEGARHIQGYIPTAYHWWWFVAGVAVASAGLTRVYRRGCLGE